ncbi:MAG: aminopeptidase [Selenomonadales bacterium]|nr:aminopeptidase [Selenomonadales bacterium]
MQSYERFLDNYASLIVGAGVNIQKGQLLVIQTPIECADFARRIAKKAYERGAKDVVMNWRDELFTKLRFLNAPEEVFSEFPEWQKEYYKFYADRGAAFISIAANDPELLKEVDPKRVAMVQKTSSTALAEHREKLMSNENAWCVVSMPTKAWAMKVFPELSVDEAIGALWQAILESVRADADDPTLAWEAHKKALRARMAFLNRHNFRRLRYQNSLGTDLVVGLPEGHQWLGGAEKTKAGVEFIANIPTEEVFTLPHKNEVNGVVYSSKPLNYQGNLIDRFSLVFKEGKVTDCSAVIGQEVLKNLIATDDGASRLGEVALVPFDSPISNSNILFYNTLFDENASCHLAFGKAYPVCLAGGEEMDRAALEAAGVNDSLVHVDFMIGTSDLTIDGQTADGQWIPVFRNGNFVE